MACLRFAVCVVALSLVAAHARILPGSFSEPDECLNAVSAAAAYDERFETRLGHKGSAANSAASAEQFEELMLQQRETGTMYGCIYAMGWVSEVFEGLRRQWEEYRYQPYDFRAGYVELFGDDIIAAIAARRGVTNARVLYHIILLGNHVHAFLVEQLPNQLGFRVHETFRGAYGMRAWLLRSTSELSLAFDKGLLMLPGELYGGMDSVVRNLTRGEGSLANFEIIEKHFPQYAPLLPYLRFVRDYNKGAVLDNFQRAWSQFGQGQVLSWDKFHPSFLAPLANLTAGMRALGTTTSAPYPADLYDTWISLFGSPDPWAYPGVPNNAIIPFFHPELPPLSARVLAVEVPFPENCAANAKVLIEAATRQTSPARAPAFGGNEFRLFR
eukprot:RCo022963